MIGRVEHLSDDVALYHSSALDILETIVKPDIVISDPPYPNRAGHFNNGIAVAEQVCRTFVCDRWLVFWTELEPPPVSLPLVAVHIWHRSNTNRPDNYEPIFVFNRDGKKRASRVMSYPVVSVGLTGCWEATGHPTQKHTGLMAELISKHTLAGEIVFDPFMGSGTTGVATVKTGRKFIGCELDQKFFDISCRRIQNELNQPRLNLEKPQRIMQKTLL